MAVSVWVGREEEKEEEEVQRALNVFLRFIAF